MPNAGEYDGRFAFEITGVSYIGAPRAGTAMFVAKKLEGLLGALESVAGCLVFAGRDVAVPAALREKHCFVMCDDPGAEYGRLAERLWQPLEAAQRVRGYTLAPGGYTLGEGVELGRDVYIEPGVFIGHDVCLGDGSTVLAGAVVRNARVGAGCLVRERAVIGGQGFTVYRDEAGCYRRQYNFGLVYLENGVEIGANTTVCRGSSDDTWIGAHTKVDDGVYVAHDVKCGQNVLMTGHVTVGGFCEIGDEVFIGFGATLRNRITVGRGARVGMGSVVTKPVAAGTTVMGNPAKPRE